MSAIPRYIRLAKAVRETCEMYDRMAFAFEMDRGFDAGEFSGPAIAREERKQEFQIAGRNRVTQDSVYTQIQLDSFFIPEQEG